MSSAIQVAKTATYLPDLVEVQRGSFKWFLEKGLIEELESFSPITDYTGKLELHFVGSEYPVSYTHLTLPTNREV